MKKILLFIFLVATFAASAQQRNRDILQQKAMRMKRFLEQHHYKPLEWNDSASAMLYNKWLSNMDEEKLFFLQKDIAALATYKYKLDDELRGDSWNFFSLSTSLLQMRIHQADSVIKTAMGKPFDFSKPDDFIWPNKEYAVDERESAQRWQKYLKWRVLQTIADEMTNGEKKMSGSSPADLAALEKKARDKIRKSEVAYITNLLPDPKEFITEEQDSYLNTIAWCYDPHTSYMNMKEKHEFDTKMSAAQYSAGLDMEENEKGELAISYLQPGGSAWRSGQLHTGDVIVKVKVKGVLKDAAYLSEEELENLLAGESEEAIEVTVKTAAGEIKTVKLAREIASDEESVVKSYVLRGNKNIGYINLPGFYSRENESAKNERDLTYDGCANDVSKEIVKLRKDTIAGLIIDLRFNGGGSMWEAMQLAGIFIDIGPVASTKEKDGKVHFLKSYRGTIYDGPLILLINGFSASASEFLAAALQDYNRALIVGSTTYGKGSAQIVLPMDTTSNASANGKLYEDYVKVTEEKFYRVNGSTTQWQGVIPDIPLPDIYADDAYREKANESALQPDNTKTGIYQQLKPIPVQTLKINSAQRVATDNYFKTVSLYTDWRKQYNAGRTISLQWAGYASQYNKTLELFSLLKDDENNPVFVVSNNSFDAQRINHSTNRSQETNTAYLKQVKDDDYIKESFKIMLDWAGK